MGIETALIIGGIAAAAAAGTAGTMALARPSTTGKMPVLPEILGDQDEESQRKAEKLARQRRDLEAKRMGRRSLRIDKPEEGFLPGLATEGQTTGLRIPK